MSQLENIKLSQHPMASIEIGELEYHYIQKGRGEALVFLHGFPDLANTWDEAIAHFSDQYCCIAPFLRGYYPTAIPIDGDYRIKTLAEDIGQLLEKLGFESYFVVGQDWGASVAYALANLFPEKVKKLVTIAIPHPAYIKLNPIALWKARHFVRLRNPKSSLPYARRNEMAYIERLIRRWSPNWTEAGELVKLIKETFAMEGRLEAALGYYWSFNEALKDREQLRFYGRRPKMPLLTLAGMSDGSVQLKKFYKMREGLKNDFQLDIHPTAGHFLHREAPEYFVEKLEEFLAN